MLNTGTEPSAPPIDGLAGTPFWTNRDALRLAELPGSLIVIGGGAIGAEMTQAFARFGVHVRCSRSPTGSSPRRSPSRAHWWLTCSPARASRCTPG